MNLYLVTAGAITAIGLDLQRTIASLRSGLDRFKEIPFSGTSGEDLQGAPIEGYAEGLGGIYRYEALTRKALLPCLTDLSPEERQRTGIFLGLPRADRPGVPSGLINTLPPLLAPNIGVPQHAIFLMQLGRAAVFRLLEEARQYLKLGKFHTCIVGGVDTLLNGSSLKQLSEAGLLKEDWDGFIPGEAAAFVRVSNKPSIGHWGRPSAAIAGIGIATETADGTAANPLVGVGMKAAFEAAMNDAGLPESEVHLYINDINGERAAFEDAAMGYIRFFRSPRKHLEVWHCASYLGETGAAVGALELIWGSAALELGFAPGPGIMLSAADGQLRTAVFMYSPRGETTSSLQPLFRIGRGQPILHSEPPQHIEPADDDPGLHLVGVDDLHGDLLWQNFQELSWLMALRQRHHFEGVDPWADIEGFEQRLVAHLDALAWSGTRARNLAAKFLMSDEMEDVAAAAMILLSFPLEQDAWHLLRDAILESKERCEAIFSVLPHVPRETAEPALRALASSKIPALISRAIRALTIAGWISEEVIRPYLQTTGPQLVGPLVEAAGAAGFNHWWESLRLLVEAYPKRLEGHDTLGLLAIAPQRTGVLGLNRQELKVRDPVALAMSCLRDGTSFFEEVPPDSIGAPAVLEAVGWSGEQEARLLLLKALDGGNDEQKSAAANALYRIFGCECYEEIELPASGIPEDEVPEEMIKVKRLSHDRAVWEEALQLFYRQPRGDSRLRHGQPWNRYSPLHHLQRPEATYHERLLAAWEYAIVNRAPRPFHPSLFVERQRAAIAGLPSRL